MMPIKAYLNGFFWKKVKKKKGTKLSIQNMNMEGFIVYFFRIKVKI